MVCLLGMRGVSKSTYLPWGLGGQSWDDTPGNQVPCCLVEKPWVKIPPSRPRQDREEPYTAISNVWSTAPVSTVLMRYLCAPHVRIWRKLKGLPRSGKYGAGIKCPRKTWQMPLHRIRLRNSRVAFFEEFLFQNHQGGEEKSNWIQRGQSSPWRECWLSI